MTAAVPSPDLQRIVEALKACRDDLAVQYFGDGPDAYLVISQARGQVFRGTVEDCSAYIDARCAEAMVRAMKDLLRRISITPIMRATLNGSILDVSEFIDSTDDKEALAALGIPWPESPYDRYSILHEDTCELVLNTAFNASLSAILGETQP